MRKLPLTPDFPSFQPLGSLWLYAIICNFYARTDLKLFKMILIGEYS